MSTWWGKFTGKYQYDQVKNEDENYYSNKSTDEEEKFKISSWHAFWNVCNSIQGVAILAMPYVIRGGGLWSILALVVVAAVSNYTGQILMKCHYDESVDEENGQVVRVRTRDSYAEVGKAIWPEYGKQIVLSVQVLELLFMATLYPIVTASVLTTILPSKYLPTVIWVIIFGIVIYPNVFLRQLYHISVMSTVTVISAGLITLAIVLYCFTEVTSWHMGQMLSVAPKEYITAIGVMIASYSSQMYLSVIESSMKNPEQIGTVMNYGYTAMTLLKIGIGVVAYLTFGNDTSQVVTLNLPSGVLLTTVNIVVLLLALSSYTMPMFTAFEILEKDSSIFEKSENEAAPEPFSRELLRIGIRSSLVLATLVMAISVPHFCLFLSFIGCFTGTFLEIVFPCAFYIVLKYDKLSIKEIVFNVFLIMFSLSFMGVGMYFSGYAIGKAFKLHTKEVWTVD